LVHLCFSASPGLGYSSLKYCICCQPSCSQHKFRALCFSNGQSTPWSRVLFEETNVQLIDKFPAFYGIWKVIAMFTISHHWTLSWARWIPSTSSSYAVYMRSILLLSSHLLLCFSIGFFPSDVLTKMYEFFVTPMIWWL
jgi:hypothetical protein